MLPLFLLPSSADEWRDWLVDDAPKVAGVVLAIIVLKLVSRPIIGHTLRGAARSTARLSGDPIASVERRVRTIEGTLSWLVTLIAGFIGAAIVLDTLGLNVAPLVAGVGIVGIAIGLGAQTLIKDVINGIFILVEDQYAVGDQVTLAGVTGEVLEVNPRRTLVRDGEGNTHSIPNSTITTATNRTASLQRLHVVVEVAFRDASEAARLAHEVSAAIADERRGDVLAPPTVRGYQIVADGDARLDILGDARPKVRWEIEGELRRRLLRRFEEAKLEARFPMGSEK